MATLVVLFPLLACVVLKPNHLENRNSPPTVFVPENSPRPDSIIRFKTDGMVSNVSLRVQVSDPDDERVIGRVFVDTLGESSVFHSTFAWDPTPNGAPTSAVLNIPRTTLDAGKCYRVTLLASSAFATAEDGGNDDDTRIPVRPGDLTSVTWWVLAYDTITQAPMVDGCL